MVTISNVTILSSALKASVDGSLLHRRHQICIIQYDIKKLKKNPLTKTPPINHDVLHPSHNLVTGEPGSVLSSSGSVNSADPNQVNYPPDHLRRWTKDHPLDNIVGNPSRPVSTRNQFTSDALWCLFPYRTAKISQPKNFKIAGKKDLLDFQAMQDEIHEFDHP
ncbi:hypothetical protein Tco_0893557 [Tanacetum coccineum]|uniref:Uncharacterized protein n=1 Tax=Tanacetum coccineum TaxID=301880 RepID=A0ABQ5C953_9ASTR